MTLCSLTLSHTSRYSKFWLIIEFEIEHLRTISRVWNVWIIKCRSRISADRSERTGRCLQSWFKASFRHGR